MASFSKEQVIAQMRDKDLGYYEVLDDDKKTLLDDHDSGHVQKAIDQLENFLRDIKGKYIFVKCYATKDEGKGGSRSQKYWYKIELNPTAETTTGSNQSVLGIGALQTYANEKAQLLGEIEKLKYEKELQSIRTDFDKKLEDSQDKTMQLLTAFAPMISGMFGNKLPTPVQGTVINGTEVDQKEKLKNALAKLRAVDADYIETLTQLAAFAEKNPEQYHSFKPMLKTI